MEKFWIKEMLKVLIPLLLVTFAIWVVYIIKPNIVFFILGILGLVLTVFTIYFFRSPDRKIPDIPNAILAPADGTLVEIVREKDNFFFNGKEVTRISIFLSVFNVHVNRIPTSGKVIYSFYNKGKFLAAFNHKASLENEQMMLGIETKYGNLLVKQIAGLIARRIISFPKLNDEVKQGELYGMIRFGSRVDVLFDADVDIKVKVGDKIKGGETILGVFK